MATVKKEKVNARVVLQDVILSFPRLFQADEKGKFSVSLVLLTATEVKKLADAALTVAKSVYGEKASAMLASGELKCSLRTQEWDVKKKGYDKVSGIAFVNARSNQRPGVVDSGLNKVVDAEEVYAGRHANASVTAFYYPPNEGNDGIGFGINNVQLTKHGERLDTRIEAEDEFAPIDGKAAD